MALKEVVSYLGDPIGKLLGLIGVKNLHRVEATETRGLTTYRGNHLNDQKLG